MDRPTFSIIVPTWGEFEALGRTLINIILQAPASQDILRDIIVVGDGFEAEAQAMCQEAQNFARQEGQNVMVFYTHLKGHSGGGNLPRRAGLKAAKRDWVLFIDAGTSVCHNAFITLEKAITGAPQAKIITWDMVQLLDPVPVTTTAYAVSKLDRSKGLPYVLPGCATAVLREEAQRLDWPDVPASDWAYFSKLWELIFGVPENAERVDTEVVLIPWVLTVAYGGRSVRKERMPLSKEAYENAGYSMGWQTATAEVVEASPEGSATNA